MNGIDIGRIGRRLRLLREQSGRTQSQLARDAGLSERAVRDLEAGRTNPTLATVAGMTDVLGVTLDELVAAARETVAADWTPRSSETVETAALTRLLPNPRMRARIVHFGGLGGAEPSLPLSAVFGHVLEGGVAVVLDKDETSLSVGDSFHAQARVLRRWHGRPAGRLMVVEATDGGDAGIQLRGQAPA